MRETIQRRLPATRHADFRALWGGTACSSVSLWTLLLGNAWIVFQLSDSSAWVGVSTFASMSPFLLSPIGGVVADRYERKYLVRITRIGAFATTTTLFFLALSGVIEVWMVIGVALIPRLLHFASSDHLFAGLRRHRLPNYGACQSAYSELPALSASPT